MDETFTLYDENKTKQFKCTKIVKMLEKELNIIVCDHIIPEKKSDTKTKILPKTEYKEEFLFLFS